MENTWTSHYPKGIPAEIDADKFNDIIEVFLQSCRRFKDNIAFSNMGVSYTFKELEDYTEAMAAYFQKELGLKKGDRVAIQMPNCLQYPIALFGALRAGLIVVNTNPLYTPREMEHQFNDADVQAIVIIANFAGNLEQVISKTNIKHVVVTELGDLFPPVKKFLVNFVVKHVKKMVPPFHLPKSVTFAQAIERGSRHKLDHVSFKNSDVAFLQYTGGTTGVSKGAILTHRNVIANLEQASTWMAPRLKEGQEIIITALPLYHIFSLTVNCLAFMKFGAENVLITNPKDIPGFIKELKRKPFTVLTGVNTLFNALMNDPGFTSVNFSKLKICVGGAMALQRAVCERWRELTKTVLIEGYGLTEASPIVSCNPVDGTDQIGTIGLPVPSTEIKLVDEDENEVPPGEAGELCVKGPQVMTGYWNRPDETTKVLKGGWLHTGDVAQAVDNGFFKIVDRKKDMILVSGFNVYPNEIEDVVAAHPGVLEVAAVGVQDEKSGEVVKIFVVKKDPALTKETLISYCKENLTGYKIPKQIEFRTELPKTNVGKILRRALRDAPPQAVP